MAKARIFTDQEKALILNLYEGGQSRKAISERIGVTPKVITKFLIANGLEITNKNKKHFYDEHIFDKIDTAEKAYWLGFILADGYLNESRNFLRIKLQESDKDHLYKFIRFIGGDEGMVKYEYHNVTGNKQYYAEVNGKYFTESLVKLNIRQGKSSKEQITKIPKKFIRDYIRGIWDGDGHIRDENINVISSVEVLKYIQEYLFDTCNINIGKICNHCNTYRIHICAKRYDVLDHLYYKNCIALDRKYNLARTLIYENNCRLRAKLQEALRA